LTLAAEAIGLELGRAVTPAELVRGEHRPRRPLMFATASAGNHGCAVAAAARLVQASCTVFLPDGVPSAMQRTMRGYGADLVSVTGVYEDAVAACQQRAAQAGWCLVSDTSWEGYRDPAIRVQLGYSVIAAEVQEQAQEAPTHVFIQAGVGGLAAAWAAFLALAWAPPVPRLLVVEPNRAACLLASAQAGRSVRVRAELPTNMGRLQCYEPSLVAWLQLRGLADAFVAISDDEAESASDLLAASELVTSPSGAAGLAGLSHVLADPVARAALSLDDHSRALIVITEAKPRPD
jgi:diaminopropionate ammonia-lyase